MKQTNEKELIPKYFKYRRNKKRSQEDIVLEVINLWNQEKKLLNVQEIRDLGHTALTKAWTRSPMLSYRRVKEIIFTREEYFDRLLPEIQLLITNLFNSLVTKMEQSQKESAPNDELFNIFSYNDVANPNQSTTVRNLPEKPSSHCPDIGTLMFNRTADTQSEQSNTISPMLETIDESLFYYPETLIRGLSEDFYKGSDYKQSFSEKSENNSFFSRDKSNNDWLIKEPLRLESRTNSTSSDSCDKTRDMLILDKKTPVISPSPDYRNAWKLPTIKEIKKNNLKPIAKIEKTKKGISIKNAHLRIDENGKTLIEWNYANQKVGFIIDKGQTFYCVNGSIFSKSSVEPSFEIKDLLEKKVMSEKQPGFDNMEFVPVDEIEAARRDIRKSSLDKYNKWFKKNKYVNGSASTDESVDDCQLVDASKTEASVIAAVAYERWKKYLSRDTSITEDKYGLTKKFIKTVHYRLKDGFTPADIVRGTIACTLDEYHKKNKIDFLMSGIHSEKKLRQAVQMRKAQKGESVKKVDGITKLREEKSGVYRDPVTGKKISYDRYQARMSAIKDLEEQQEQRRMEASFSEE
jgi:hypothetical protein